MMKNNCLRVGVSLSLFFFSISALSGEPQLNGLATHRYLGREIFIAALYTEKLTSNLTTLLRDDQVIRMELKITTGNYSAKRLNGMWIEGMAINSSEAELRKYAPNMINFTQLLKKPLLKGDFLIIEHIPAEGAKVSVNGVELGNIQAKGFFQVLLRAWIGAVPLSSDFRNGLLQSGKIDNELLARYISVTPTFERIALVKSWIAPPEPLTALESIEIPDKTRIETVKFTTPPKEPDIDEDYKDRVVETSFNQSTPENKPEPTALQPTTLELLESQPTEPQSTESQPTESQPTRPQQTLAMHIPVEEAVLTDREPNEIEEDSMPMLTAERLVSRQLFHSKLLKWTYRYIEYPLRAQQLLQQGSIRLSIIIDRNGKLEDVSVVEKSRYVLLNKEAVSAVKKASPYPPMPEELLGDKFEFSLPIEFRIQ